MCNKFIGSDYFYLSPTNDYDVIKVSGYGEEDIETVFHGTFEECMNYMAREQANYRRNYEVDDGES